MADLLLDRWETAAAYGFGRDSSCYDSAVIIGDVIVGESTWIGPNVVLDGSGGLRIGSHVSVSAGVQIYTHQSIAWSTTLGNSPIVRKPTTIGDGVYIGPHAVIEMGCTIGDRAVIGAMTLVRGDVPAGYRCFGLPGRLWEPKA